MLKKNLIAFTAFILICVVQANAQEQSTLTPEKRRLIEELMVVTKQQQQATAVMEAVLAQTERNSKELMLAASEDVKVEAMSASEQAELEAQIRASSERVSLRVREVLFKRINIAQVVTDISYKLYDKFFTEQELSDLVAFYKSTTGQKSIAVMPQLFAESMKMASEAMMPQIQAAMKEIIEEETKRLKTDNHDSPRKRSTKR